MYGIGGRGRGGSMGGCWRRGWEGEEVVGEEVGRAM